MKFLLILFSYLIIKSTNYEINKIFPNILHRVPVYSHFDSYIYFESNNFTSNDIYLYLEDESYVISYINICYTNEDPILSSTIDNCTFNKINPYTKIKDIPKPDQYFYKFPKKGKFIIIKNSAGYPGIFKVQIANHDLKDEIKELYTTPLPPLTIAVIALGGTLVIGIALVIIFFCYIDKKLNKIKINQINNESNEPLNQPDVINQNIQNQEQEHTPIPIINNE